jgi:tetratricopeptide (TPR) repeat protein
VTDSADLFSASHPQAESPAVRARLSRGFQYEQGAANQRALDEYRSALDSATTAGDEAHARLRIARILRSMSEWESAIAEAHHAASLAASAGNEDLAAEAMNIEITIHQIRGEFQNADALSAQALQRAQSPRVRGITLQNRGRGAAERGDFAAADQYFAESVEAFREAGYDLGMAVALTNLSAVARDKGDAERALEIGREATALCRRLNALDTLLIAVQNEASALVALGRLDQAEQLLTEALGHFTSAKNLIRQAECLEVMGRVSERRSDLETALRCYERARKLASDLGDAPLLERLNREIKRCTAARGGSAP